MSSQTTSGQTTLSLSKPATIALLGFSLLIVSSSLIPKKAQAVTETVPLDIAADCSVDVTADILAWIASAPDNSTLQFGQNACYRVDGTLKVLNRNNLTFEGNNATFRVVTNGTELGSASARDRAIWGIQNGSNITLKNMTIQGPNPNAGTGDSAYVAALEGQHGIRFGSVQGGLVDNVNVYDVYGDFVYFGLAYNSQVPSKNITVRNSHFERNGRQGISWTGAEDILVEHNFISQVRRTMFDIEPNSTAGNVRRITINQNQLGPKRLGFLSATGAGSIVEDITLSNNTLTGAGLAAGVNAPVGTRRSRIKIINNTSDIGEGNSGGSSFYFTRTDDIEVSGNTMRVQPDRNMSAVQLYGSTNARIFNNTFLNVITTLRADPDSYGNQSSDYLACGNKIVSNEGFTDPAACTPPTVRIDTPLNGTSLSNTAKITASVNDWLGIKQVELYIDGVLQEADATAPYEYTWDTKAMPDNTSHIIKAVAIDRAGLEWSNEITVTINNGLTENWNNSDNFAWPDRWVFEGATSGIKLRDIQNNQGRVVENPGASGMVLAYLNGQSTTSLNQTTQFRISSNNASVGLMARRSDANSDTYYYAVAVAGAPDNLRIKKMVNGVATNIAYISRPMVSNADYKMRFEVGPDTDPAKTALKVKVWDASVDEPAAYNLSKADAEPTLQAVNGRFGLVYGLSNSRTVWTDNYSAVILAP